MSIPFRTSSSHIPFSSGERKSLVADCQNKTKSKKRKNKNRNRSKANQSVEKKDVENQTATTDTTRWSDSWGSMLARRLVLPPPSARNLVATLRNLLGTNEEVVDPELPLLLWGHIYNCLNGFREPNLAVQRLQLGADVFDAGDHALVRFLISEYHPPL
jgi:hypothetical protein